MKRLMCLLFVFCATTSAAWAYVEVPYTLGRVVNESTNVVLMKVEKVNKERKLIYYKKIADLKGKHPAEQFKHQITDGGHPREPRGILDWARPGRVAIGFINDKVFLTYTGRVWYESAAGEPPWWVMTRGLQVTDDAAAAYQAAGEALLTAYAKVKELAFAALCERLFGVRARHVG
jgi:hypothetical protein